MSRRQRRRTEGVRAPRDSGSGLRRLARSGEAERQERRHPISASRTASRFGFCQPFCDPLGPVLTFKFLNNYGVFWEFCIGGIGSGGRRSVKPSCRRAKARFVSSLTLREGDVRSLSGRYTESRRAADPAPTHPHLFQENLNSAHRFCGRPRFRSR